MRWSALIARTVAVAGIASLALSVGAFVAIRAAQADPGGPTRNALSFSGILRTASGSVVTGAHALSFRFRHGTTVLCTAPTSGMITPDPTTGAFEARVELDMATPEPCPPRLFDGSEVTFDVLVDGVALTPGQRVNAVPYAHFAERVGVHNDCPASFSRDATASPGIVCTRAFLLGPTRLLDEVVRVGSGAEAFWVDRYEASVYGVASGTQLGTTGPTAAADDIPTSGIGHSGSWSGSAPPAFALSHEGMPSAMVTWFQANQLCRALGKRLPTGSEWFAAASGTVDDATCITVPESPRAASAANRCRSTWGAHDMIGNVSEWTDEWFTSVGMITSPAATTLGASVAGLPVNGSLGVWPVDFGDGQDGTWNITTTVFASAGPTIGLPAGAQRGGAFAYGARGGVFTLDLAWSPSSPVYNTGFRCVIPR